MATTRTAKTTADTIAKMRALAEHPNTPECEAEAAKRYLARLVARTAAEAGPRTRSWEDRLHFIGAKYDGKLTMTEIAKRIREEIKLARRYGAAETAPGALATIDPIGAAPAGIKFSVRQPHYGSIVIALKNLPADWAWTRGADRWGKDVPLETAALKALKTELHLIMSAYNYDGSDSLSDYYDVNFYGRVDVDWPEVPH